MEASSGAWRVPGTWSTQLRQASWKLPSPPPPLPLRPGSSLGVAQASLAHGPPSATAGAPARPGLSSSLSLNLSKPCVRCEAKGKGGGGKKKSGGALSGAQGAEGEGASPAPAAVTPYTQGEVIIQSLEIIDSHFRALGSPIFSEAVDIASAAKCLWEADFVVMSHGLEEDPIYNYGNAKCLALFETSWADFTKMPSRLSCPEPGQQQRNELLQEAQTGVKDLKGCIRVSTTGRLYEIDEGSLWTLISTSGENLGQAAVLRQWHYLDDEDKGDEKAEGKEKEAGQEQEQKGPGERGEATDQISAEVPESTASPEGVEAQPQQLSS